MDMSIQDEYFASYGDLEVHRIMLKDERRCLAYKSGIEGNPQIFEGKTVMDLGAGTGILSVFCIKSGARKVYSVEASKDMVEILKSTVKDNECCDCIEVIEGAVEDIDLEEKVDVIVSEWMGFTLLHEGMLNSVLYARKFLKPNGLLVPDKCQLYVSLCKVPSLLKSYNDINGIDMSHFGREWRSLFDGRPEIYQLDLKTDDIVSKPASVLNFDISQLTSDELKEIKRSIKLVVDQETFCDALCFWFDVQLINQTFSTSPLLPETHWKQTLIVFPERLNVSQGNTVDFDLSMIQDKRRYIMTVENIVWS